jgi:hypothetical protein
MREIFPSRRSKGQTFMPDFMASMVIFGLVLTVFLSSWSTVVSDQGELEKEGVIDTADRTSTFLVSTSGYPENWNSDSVEIVGFAQSENILDFDKIREFGDISYSNQTRLMRARDFYLEFENETGTMQIGGETLFYGKDFTDASFVYPVKRTVKINDSGDLYDARMRYVVYR